MKEMARVVEVDLDLDEVRWTLPDLMAYQCRRCQQVITVTVNGCTREDEPLLVCGRCVRLAKRRVILDPVFAPPAKNG